MRCRRTFISLTAGAVILATAVGIPAVVSAEPPAVVPQALPFEIQSLDGRGNNVANPQWGLAGTQYSRVAPARYADGRSEPVDGPNARRVGNRTFNDVHQNLFSERNVTQWGFTWGQFLDHTFGLREGRAPGDPDGETRNIPFDSNDPLEEFENTLGYLPFVRSNPAPGTGVDNPRQQINTVSSYIDAHPVYGGTAQRLEWLRNGPFDGNAGNNASTLLLPGDYLPRRTARGDPAAAPVMEIEGRLRSTPNRAAVAGDVRANENIALQATHTLFAREHNRITRLLPAGLTEEEKFQIARRVVIAEQQFITYAEFLPSLGIRLPAYRGYRPDVNTTLGNEFATVGYRAHSMIHGEVELETNVDRYTPQQLEAFEAMGIEVEQEGADVELAVPLNVAFFNPDLVEQLQLGPLLQGIGLEAQYKNDEQIDNQLRSVLFQVPVPGNPDCLDGPDLPRCFRGVQDLGAIDIERARDHGMPTYNRLRQAYGLAARTSFRAITGEATEEFPPGTGPDDPRGLAFQRLNDVNGDEIPLDHEDAESSATDGVRGSTVAARLKALYGSVDRLDAFTGMIAERHAAGGDFGELQRAIWTREFRQLRDGDRFFYQNDPGLTEIRNRYGIDYRRNLGDIIAANTDIPRSDLADNVFFVDGENPPVSCSVAYRVVNQWSTGFEANVTVTNTGSTPVSDWSVRWTYRNGQRVTADWDTVIEQGRAVRARNESYNRPIPANGGRVRFGFIGAKPGAANDPPRVISLNTTRCALT